MSVVVETAGGQSKNMWRWPRLVEDLFTGGERARSAARPTQLRIRSLSVAMVLMIAISAPFLFHYWSLGILHMSVVLGGCVVVSAANIWQIRTTHNVTLGGYIACLMLYTLLVVSNVTSGGFYQPNFAWLYVVPLVGAIIANVRVAAVLTLLVLATAVVFWMLPYWGIDLPSAVPASEQATQSLANRLSAICAVGVLTWLFARQQQRAEYSLRGAHAALEEESERVAQLAYFDELTGLPNRRKFREHLEATLQTCSDNCSAVLFIDIDRFKDVNDSLGHTAGDQLLQIVGRRLVRVLRRAEEQQCDEPELAGHMVARLGGDEFTILLEGVVRDAVVAQLTNRLLDALREPFMLGTQEVFLSASVGIAFAPRDSDTAESLLMCADTAMYESKRMGGDGMTFFTENMGQGHKKRLVIGSRLRRALEADDGLYLVYQPIVNRETQTITALEALLRWKAADGSVISPGEFVPVAEATGLASRLDCWVLARALRDLKQLHDSGYDELKVAVNISASHMRDASLADTVQSLVAASGAKAECLELEITESALIATDGAVAENLHRLRRRNIGIALDDFGTGYSSLSHLREFPVSKLKIDRSFVMNATVEGADAKVCTAIAKLGSALGLEVVAEGVETPSQRDLMAELGCSHFQGYFFGRPMALNHVLVYLRDEMPQRPVPQVAQLRLVEQVASR